MPVTNAVGHSPPATLAAIRIVFYLLCFLIVYGSLYPFEFSSTPDSRVLAEFGQSWKQASGLGDILGNIALFVPYGFFGYLLFGYRRGLGQALLLLSGIWIVVAIGSQLVQLYLPSRSPTLFDAWGNAFGFLLGVVMAYPRWVRQLIDAGGVRFFRNRGRILGVDPAILAWVVLAAFFFNGLFPLTLRDDPSTFYWLPFSRYLEGSMFINAGVLGQKLLAFGAVLWLLKISRPLGWRLVLSVSALVMVLELLQLWIVAKTADVTDPLLVLVVAWFLRHVGHGEDAHASAFVRTAEHSEHAAESTQNRFAKPVVDQPFGRRAERRKVILTLVAACIGIMVSLFVVVRLPGVPYNVRELFWQGGNGLDLLFFSLALLGFGGGSAWLGWVMANSKRPAVMAPLAAMLVSVVIYQLFAMSVTRESIMDVAGSSVVVHRVGQLGVLGQGGIDFVAWFGAEKLRGITDLFEPAIRFGALVGPLIIFFGMFIAAQYQQMRQPRKLGGARVLAFSRQLLAYLVFMFPWLFFCKVVAFDWWSTDNLIELIDGEGAFGLGGGGYLYVLIALIALSAAGLARSLGRSKGEAGRMLLLSILAVPIGWWMLNAGLADRVAKYGAEFSGVDFLLGPDRNNLLSTTELFLRWSVLQLAMVMGLAFGASLYLRWMGGELVAREISGQQTVQPEEPQQELKKATLVGPGEERKPRVEREDEWDERDQRPEMEVHFHPEQIDYLDGVAEAKGISVSSVIGIILGYLEREMRNSEEVHLKLEQIICRSSGSSIRGNDLIFEYIRLPTEQLKFVRRMQLKLGVSASRVVRRLLGQFMILSEEESRLARQGRPRDSV